MKNAPGIEEKEVDLKLINIGSETFFQITNHDLMRPFFMSIVSDSNHWMFISSNGGLTAGRKDADNALFPYYTDDKITESNEITGSKSLFRVRKNNDNHLWEPFSIRGEGKYNFTRNIYKNLYGNKILFEEINEDLGLTFRYKWSSGNQFGFIRESTLINNTEQSIQLEILDGIQNIVPYGVLSDLQATRSNLVDAYKKNELEAEVGLGIYALSAIIVDRAEPSEALKATIAWSIGLNNPKYLLSSSQLDQFRNGNEITQEVDIKAEKGAYFLHEEIAVSPKDEKSWTIIANVNQNASDIAALAERIRTRKKELTSEIENDIADGTQRLINLVSASDGFRKTSDFKRNARHYSNTLFNIMRGGIFDFNYQIEKWDFKNYLKKANKEIFTELGDLIAELPEIFTHQDLKRLAEKSNNPHFQRLAIEYMPLKFSRRHGDPSRPWNRFSINTRNEEDGSKILDYEGNWRDIFQNWEALALSYPEFIESMIFKFLNASTFDGYNPYRVTKDGFDWETIEPHDPWSYIGYWGDHQIIYLLKFLEIIENHYPDKLKHYFNKELFVYANVPYRIKPYEDIVKNPKDTILFDDDLDRSIRTRRNQIGSDGAFLHDSSGAIYRVNFIEKLLATVLAKLSNFIPEAGIWLNTQRPEWNDANNALVGNGVSMVTLYYLRRFFAFLEQLLASDQPGNTIHISQELHSFFNDIHSSFGDHKSSLSSSTTDHYRKQVLDALGTAGSRFRNQIYSNGFSGKKEGVKVEVLLEFSKTVLSILDHSIDANKRSDGMYHAYNLISIDEEKVSISYLSEMLEGQVASLSAGYLSSQECLRLLDTLKSSALFRDDQYSYLLYPDKELPRFVNKNVIPAKDVESSLLLKQLIKDGNETIVQKDVSGNYHFNGNFNNAQNLKRALKNLPPQYNDLIKKEYNSLLDLFEEVFNHKAFTGRSGTFFGYEGLGSIYWHMVSKLLLAVEEVCLAAIRNNESEEVIGRLLEHFYEINEGIGVHKSPKLFGAFPIDPYSHTPSGKGAQQPGMTGQVKEDILSRVGEIGVFVKNGEIVFNPCLLRRSEFLSEKGEFHFVDLQKNNQRITLDQNSLVFTYCQVPIIYKIAKKNGIRVFFKEGKSEEFETLSLGLKISKELFQRTGNIERIEVNLIENQLK